MLILCILLFISALQVKVFPTTDGQTVTLMCSTACALTDKPAAYIWYRNSELLYQDWSPWYQEMVTSDKTVRYSCAIKGHEALRAPAVTVGMSWFTGVSTTKGILQFISSEFNPATSSLSTQNQSPLPALRCPTMKGECVCITTLQ